MGAPLIEDKRWSIDLEKRIQEEHYSNSEIYNQRYAFNPKSGKEIFVVDTPCLTLAVHGISARLLNIQ